MVVARADPVEQCTRNFGPQSLARNLRHGGLHL